MKQVFSRLREKIEICSKSNQGFTLVELLTSLSIFSFFVIALLNYMITASSVTSKVSSSVNLSMQSQVALGMIEEYLIDCSGLVEFVDNADTSVLYIVNNKGYVDDDPIIFKFEYDKTDRSLYFQEGKASRTVTYDRVTSVDGSEVRSVATGVEYRREGEYKSKELLSMNIDAFHVDIVEESIHLSGGNMQDVVKSVEIVFDMTLGRDTYQGETFISLRNSPVNEELLNR